MLFTVIADGALFASLTFGVVHLWLDVLHRHGSVAPWLGLPAAALDATLAAVTALIMVALPDPHAHRYAASSFALRACVCLHLGIAVLLVAGSAARRRSGHIGPRRDHDLRLMRVWRDLTAASGGVAVGVEPILPHLVSGGPP